MIELTIFPLILGDKKVKIGYETDIKSIEHKFDMIKNLIPNTLRPLDDYLVGKGFSVLAYSLKSVGYKKVFSFLTELNVFKIKTDKNKHTTFEIVDVKSQEITHDYKLIDLVDYIDTEMLNDYFSFINESDSDRVVLYMSCILQELLDKRFLV